MWIPKPETANWEAPAGLAPWRELTDEEFAGLNERIGGGLERWYEHVEDKKKKAAKAAGGEG